MMGTRPRANIAALASTLDARATELLNSFDAAAEDQLFEAANGLVERLTPGERLTDERVIAEFNATLDEHLRELLSSVDQQAVDQTFSEIDAELSDLPADFDLPPDEKTHIRRRLLAGFVLLAAATCTGLAAGMAAGSAMVGVLAGLAIVILAWFQQLNG
jgi:hypothetical protein